MTQISLSKARSLVRSTLKTAREKELKPLAVAVLDTGGNLVAFEREDDAAPGRFEMARAKAYGAVMTGMTGSALMKRAEEQAYFINSLNGVLGGSVLPVPGGVLIRDKRGRLIGAVGVSGDVSDNDAAAAVAGIEAVGLTAEA